MARLRFAGADPQLSISDKVPTEGRAIELAVGLGAALSITIGVIALVGWGYGLPVLTRFFSERSAMQPITATCAILAGAGVLFASRTGIRRGVFVGVTLVVVAAAIQTLVEYGFGIDLGTDHLLFADGVMDQTVPYPYPGRMAAPTAAAFLLIGIAVLLTRARGRAAGLLLSACATAVLLLVMVALVGYFYMVAPLTGVLGFTQVSVPTALVLGGLSLAVLALRPDQGWIRLLIGNSVGAAAARWLLPAVVIVPVVVAALALRGSEIGLYPTEFRLALTTALTIVLLAGLALWGAWQLDSLGTVREAADALRESEATLRAFFETEGLFASIVVQEGADIYYLAANSKFAGLLGRAELAGSDITDVQPPDEVRAMAERLAQVSTSGRPVSYEQALDSETGTRWLAVTISPITGPSSDPARFATAAFEITDRKRAEVQQGFVRPTWQRCAQDDSGGECDLPEPSLQARSVISTRHPR